jgi:hypothetical protein
VQASIAELAFYRRHLFGRWKGFRPDSMDTQMMICLNVR